MKERNLMKFEYVSTTFPKGLKKQETIIKDFIDVDEVENEVLNL